MGGNQRIEKEEVFSAAGKNGSRNRCGGGLYWGKHMEGTASNLKCGPCSILPEIRRKKGYVGGPFGKKDARTWM